MSHYAKSLEVAEFMKNLVAPENQLEALASPFTGWLWRRGDGETILLEPPEGAVSARAMWRLDMYQQTEAIFAIRNPHGPGACLAFLLRSRESL